MTLWVLVSILALGVCLHRCYVWAIEREKRSNTEAVQRVHTKLFALSKVVHPPDPVKDALYNELFALDPMRRLPGVAVYPMPRDPANSAAIRSVYQRHRDIYGTQMRWEHGLFYGMDRPGYRRSRREPDVVLE
jgi:hypothetical protein